MPQNSPHFGTDGQTAVASAKMPNCRGKVDAGALGGFMGESPEAHGRLRGITLASAGPRNIAVLEVSGGWRSVLSRHGSLSGPARNRATAVSGWRQGLGRFGRDSGAQ